MKKIFASILIISSLIANGQNSTMNDLWKLYNSHDYKSVIDKAKPLLDNETNNIDLNLMIGRSYADLTDYKNAIPYLEFAELNDTYNSWQKAWALSYLGTCYFMLQDYDDSKRSIDDCIKLNATKNATNSAYGQSLLFGFSEFYKTWKIVETDKFRFHFQNLSDAEIEKYTSLREIAYKEINDFFKNSLPKKIDFYVWESREDAKKILRTNLGFAKPNFCIVHTHYQQTLGHEMTHVISNYSVEMIQKTSLINEGTSVFFDQSNQDKKQFVKDWIQANDQKVDIQAIWKKRLDYPIDLSYPLSGLFIKELIDQFGRDKFLEFFGNQTYEHAKLVFGDKLDQVIQEFENKINT